MSDISHLIAHIEENLIFAEQIELLKERVTKLEKEVRELKTLIHESKKRLF